VAILALLSLVTVTVVGPFAHTDQGRVIERDCVACVFALHAADRAAAPVAVVPSLAPIETVAALPIERPSSGETWLLESRGPPSA
jgi:hypothetical protein